MNERILELITKAGFDVEKLRMYPGGWPREDLLVLQDFAELIVRECIASIPSDGHRGDFGRAVEFCQQQILEHFGVEE